MTLVAEITADSPIAYWRLDDTTGTTAVCAPTTFNGTYTGTPTLNQTGLAPSDTPNRAVLFNNSSVLQYVQVAHNASLNAASLTVQASFDASSISGNARLVEKGLSDSGWSLRIEGTNLRWVVAGRVTVDYAFSDLGRHIAHGTYDSSTGIGKLYLDGALVAQVTGTSGSAPTPADPLRIAQKPGGSSLGDGWNGLIDDVAMYSTVLSATRIAAHATAVGLSGTPTQFTWKGYTWNRAIRSAAAPFVNSFAADHVTVDGSDYVHMTITQSGGVSVGAEFSSTTEGLGYGTYTTVVERTGGFNAMHPNVVFGGMFTYGTDAAYGHREIDFCEQSAWSGATGPWTLGHVTWMPSSSSDIYAARGGYDAANVATMSDAVQTHVSVWEPGRITFRSYHGASTAPADLYRESVIISGQTVTFNIESGGTFTGPARIPVPSDERIHFNLWVCPNYSGTSNPATVTATEVIVRDFNFTPLSTTSNSGGMRYVELRKYNSAGTAAQILPSYISLQASGAYNDVGAIEIFYPLDQAITAGLTDNTEVGLVIDGVEQERYIIENTATVHTSDGYLTRQLQGRTTLAYMEDAIVYPQNWPVAIPNGRQFVSATPGTIVRAFVAQAKALGYLSIINETSFTGSLTSNAVAWTKTLDITYSNGTTLLQVLMDLVDRGVCDVKMVGRQLQLYNSGYLAAHRTAQVRRALNMTEASSTTDSREFASTVLIEGEEGAVQEVNDSGAAASVRKRARFVSQGGISDSGTLILLAQAELDGSKAIKEEVTVGISVQPGAPQPWVDFLPGEWLYFDRGSALEELQCKQISLAVDANRDIKVGLTVKDRLSDSLEKLKRKIDAITGGNSGTYGALPNTNGPDLLAPAAPASVSNTTASYQNANGVAFAQATIIWAAVTTNTDASFLDDLAGYEVQYATTGTYQAAGNTDAATLSQHVSGLQPGVNFQSRVRAFDTNGNAGAWTTSAASTLPNDTTPPPTPSTPTVVPYLGQLRISWDGLTSGAAAMPADFDRVDVHLSTTTGFTPSTATRIGTLRSSGMWIATDLSYGVTYYVKLIARDYGGLSSSASAQASAVPEQVVQTDLATGSVSFDQIAFKDPGNLIADGSFESSTQRSILASAPYGGNWAANGGVFGNTAANRYNGDWYMQWAANVSGQFMYLTPTASANVEVRVLGGSKVYARFAVRGITGFSSSTVFARIDTRIRYNDGTFTDHQVCSTVAASITTSWQEISGTFTIPANAQSAVFYAEVGGLTTGNLLTDAYEVRPVIGTALIDDAAITTAKIANLAVNDAKIANLAVGKLTAGILSADVTLSSRIATALTGARVELNSSGLHAFNSSGTETVTIANDGSASFTGTILGGSLRMPSAAENTTTPGRAIIDSSAFQVQIDGTTNLFRNPSFELADASNIMSGVASFNTTSTYRSKGPLTSDFAGNLDNTTKFGRWCAKVYSATTTGYAEFSLLTLAPSTTYTLSFYASFGMVDESVQAPFEAAYANFQNVLIKEIGGSARTLSTSCDGGRFTEGAFKGFPITPFTPGSSTQQLIGQLGWTNRWYKTFTTPSDLVAGGACLLRLPAYVSSTGTANGAKAVFYDGVQVEAKTYPTLYCDGTQAECTWTGTANASSSTRSLHSPMWFSYADGLELGGRVQAGDLKASNSFKLGSGSAHGSNYIQVYRTVADTLTTGVWADVLFESTIASDRVSADDGTPITTNFKEFVSWAPGFYILSTTISFTGNATGRRGIRVLNSAGSTIFAHLLEGVPTTSAIPYTLAFVGFLAGNGAAIKIQAFQDSGGNLTMPANAATTPKSAVFYQLL